MKPAAEKLQNRHLSSRASSLAEYMALFLMIVAALYVIQSYVVRGISGRWKATGDTFGYGRQYDPRPYGGHGEGGGTLGCRWVPELNFWVKDDCFRTARCDCFNFSAQDQRCLGCAIACINLDCLRE
ncbi:MAG: hypothetical protein NUV91_04900 [Candidatus Omnitrophica bacterium]|nr:hypothetical protein [Candidatus Omnitrophota bacterium]